MNVQLALLDEYLQAELARAPHWAEPPSKVRGTRRPVVVDYRAWLEHAASCGECGAAREDLVALRGGDLEADPAVPCSAGMRLLPLVDLDAACRRRSGPVDEARPGAAGGGAVNEPCRRDGSLVRLK